MSIQTSQKIARAPGGKLRLSAASYPVISNAQPAGANQAPYGGGSPASAAQYQPVAAYGTSGYAAAAGGYRGINPELLTTYRL